MGRYLEPLSAWPRLQNASAKQTRSHELLASKESIANGPGQGARQSVEVWPPLDAGHEHRSGRYIGPLSAEPRLQNAIAKQIRMYQHLAAKESGSNGPQEGVRQSKHICGQHSPGAITTVWYALFGRGAIGAPVAPERVRKADLKGQAQISKRERLQRTTGRCAAHANHCRHCSDVKNCGPLDHQIEAGREPGRV